MRTYLITFALSLLVALILTPLLRDWAIRRKMVDQPEGRKIHTNPIPRLGGVAVMVALIVPLLLLPFWDNRISRTLLQNTALIQALAMGIPIIAIVGIIDDLKGIRAVFKLAAQILAACAVFFSGIAIKGISIPFFVSGPLMFPIWLQLVATVFWIVLVINAINLIDGMDGLAGSVVALAGISLFIMSLLEENIIASLLLIALIGSTIGFLVYNLNPASIFLGDTGSMFLGFVLAVASVHSSQKSYALFSMIAAMMVLGLPIFDLSMAVIRRYLSGSSLFRADQHHIHHILLRKGYTQKQSMRLLFFAAVGLEVLAFISIYADDRLAAISILAIIPIAFVAVRLLGYQRIISKARRTKAVAGMEVAASARSEALHNFQQEIASQKDQEILKNALVNLSKNLGWLRIRMLVDEETWLDTQAQEDSEALNIQGLMCDSFSLSENVSIEIFQLSEEEIFGPFDLLLKELVCFHLSDWLKSNSLNHQLDTGT